MFSSPAYAFPTFHTGELPVNSRESTSAPIKRKVLQDERGGGIAHEQLRVLFPMNFIMKMGVFVNIEI